MRSRGVFQDRARAEVAGMDRSTREELARTLAHAYDGVQAAVESRRAYVPELGKLLSSMSLFLDQIYALGDGKESRSGGKDG